MSVVLPAEPSGTEPVRTPSSPAWRIVMYVIGLGLAGVAVWTVAGKTQELSGAATYLAHLRWPWIVLAVTSELMSYVAFAAAQRRLMRAGGVPVPLRSVTAITVAGNAIQNTLPAGVVLATAYSFRQFRRLGADDVLAGWVVVAVAVTSFVSLAAVAAVGVVLALDSASDLDLVGVIGGVAAVAALLVVAWVKRAAWLGRATWAVRLCQRAVHRPRGDAGAIVADAMDRLAVVSPGRRDWVAALVFSAANWVTDLGCLAFAFLAVGTGVPWHGLLLAYGAGQLAALLPVTPGGLGVVEGSLTVALVAFGGAEGSTVAAVLVYRLFNFWMMLPVGWSVWAWIKVSTRRRPVSETPDDAAAPAVPVLLSLDES